MQGKSQDCGKNLEMGTGSLIVKEINVIDGDDGDGDGGDGDGSDGVVDDGDGDVCDGDGDSNDDDSYGGDGDLNEKEKSSNMLFNLS